MALRRVALRVCSWFWRPFSPGRPPRRRTKAGFRDDAAAIDPASPSDAAPAAAEPFGLDVVPVTRRRIVDQVERRRRRDPRRERNAGALRRRCDIMSRGGAEIPRLWWRKAGRRKAAPASASSTARSISPIRPMSDLAQWGVADRWSAPLATLTSGRGDCEDYAIAKYVALIEAGFAEDDVRLVIVRDIAIGEDHAIVAARAQRKLDRARQSPPGAGEDSRDAARGAAVRARSRRRQAIHPGIGGRHAGGGTAAARRAPAALGF